MKCINKIAFALSIVMLSASLCGCGQQAPYSMEFQTSNSISSFGYGTSSNATKANGFAKNLCVTTSDVSVNTVDTTQAEAALLCDVNNQKVLYSKNAFETLNPASLTKVMTAIVALKYGNLDDVLTASANCEITESGATLVGIKAGDSMTLDQALHALLLPSGNDAAVMIAEYISGSESAFIDLMNQEAQAIGATGCHFMNPHGLTQDEHYVTAYDIYLIFNEAIKYDEFVQIISTMEYESVYHDANGAPKELTFKNSNQFINGNHDTPYGVTVIGGKTGTTNAAGNCLVILSQDSKSNPYISVILKCSQRDYLYNEMYDLIQTVGE